MAAGMALECGAENGSRSWTVAQKSNQYTVFRYGTYPRDREGMGIIAVAYLAGNACDAWGGPDMEILDCPSDLVDLKVDLDVRHDGKVGSSVQKYVDSVVASIGRLGIERDV